MIKVWSFYDAPEELQALSHHGGDEDWLAVVPPGYQNGNHWIPWAESGTPFGCCNVQEIKREDGSYVLIGAHA
jgi:hypothetical protein